VMHYAVADYPGDGRRIHRIEIQGSPAGRLPAAGPGLTARDLGADRILGANPTAQRVNRHPVRDRHRESTATQPPSSRCRSFDRDTT
jgi:hypothetical protein